MLHSYGSSIFPRIQAESRGGSKKRVGSSWFGNRAIVLNRCALLPKNLTTHRLALKLVFLGTEPSWTGTGKIVRKVFINNFHGTKNVFILSIKNVAYFPTFFINIIFIA